MGARQSKRSVDISGAKKGELENGGVEGEGKLERLEEGDVLTAKTTQNGTAPHADKEPSSPVTEEAQAVVSGDNAATETAEEKKDEAAEAKSEEKKDDSLVNGAPESPEAKDKSTDEAAATPDIKEKKKKEKPKKKWSFRSISFSRKDKSKPNVNKDDAKNGSATKEEPVAEVVEAEAAATTEAIPVKDDEPKKAEAPETTEDEKKKEEKAETSTEAQPSEPASPVPVPAEPVTAPAPLPAEPVTVPAPAPTPEPVVTPAPAPEPEPVSEPMEATPAPVVESTPEPAKEEPKEEVKPEPVVEVKIEELPPPLPASPPPTEAPPPTPVAPTPAPEEQIPDVSLHVEAEAIEPEVVGGGGESMAEPEDVEPVVDTEEKLDQTPLVNGINDHTHQYDEELNEKVEIVNENFKSIVADSIISTQVSETTELKEQTASAAD